MEETITAPPDLDDLAYIESILRPQLTPAEEPTFEVRESLVMPPNIDVFVNGKMEGVNRVEFQKKRQKGTADVAVNGYLNKLRSRYAGDRLFKIVEVLKEKYALLSKILNKKDPIPGTATQLCTEIRQMVRYITDCIAFKEKDAKNLDKDIEFLVLPGRAITYLRAGGINKVGDLTKRTIEEVNALEGIGPNATVKIKEALERLGFNYKEEKKG